MKILLIMISLLTINAFAHDCPTKPIKPTYKPVQIGDHVIYPNMCGEKKSCDLIKSFKKDFYLLPANHQGPAPLPTYTCTDYSENQFGCTDIYYQYRGEIIDLAVEVTTSYKTISDPGCHLVGGCPRCKPTGLKTAVIKLNCKEE